MFSGTRVAPPPAKTGGRRGRQQQRLVYLQQAGVDAGIEREYCLDRRVPIYGNRQSVSPGSIRYTSGVANAVGEGVSVGVGVMRSTAAVGEAQARHQRDVQTWRPRGRRGRRGFAGRR